MSRPTPAGKTSVAAVVALVLAVATACSAPEPQGEEPFDTPNDQYRD